VEIMQRLQHPHIIRLEGVYENEQTLMLVLEYARGTELFDSILQKKRYPEAEARPIFEQVAHALVYLHSLNIVHRCVPFLGWVGLSVLYVNDGLGRVCSAFSQLAPVL
jgi:serine/threonine protein kinase